MRHPGAGRDADPRWRRARIGVTAIFVLLGVGSGSLASRVPAIKGQLHLSAGALGVALLGTAIGSVLSTPVSGWVLARVAPRRWVGAGLVPFTVALPLATLAGDKWSLLAVLVAFGFGMGCIDVAMNTEATRIQDRYGRRILSTFHATFSFGALAGAGIGALAAGASIGFGTQFVAVGALVLVAGAGAAALLPGVVVGRSVVAVAGSDRAGDDHAGDDRAGHDRAGHDRADRNRRRRRGRPRRGGPIVALAVLSFGALLAEGSTNDWSAVYMHGSLGAPASTAALGYAAFSATMVAGRLSGDRLTTRWGAVRVVRTASLLGAAGLGAALLVGDPGAAITGFALLGLGLAVPFPLAIGAAAGQSAAGNRAAGASVATVTSAGYLGFLCGPPIIGGLATVASLPVALGLPVALCALLAVLAGSLRGGDPSPAPVEVLAD